MLLALHTEDGTQGEPFRRTQGGHVRQVGNIPEHNVLLLHSLIIVVVSQLTSRSEIPRHVLADVGSTDRHIEIGKLVSFAIIL